MQLRPRKKETLFYGRTDLPSRVGRSGLFFQIIFFFFLVVKMSPLKTQKSLKKMWQFFDKYFGKFSVIFTNYQAKFLRLEPKWLILNDFSKLEKNKNKNLPKWKIWVCRARKTGFSFFFFFCGLIFHFVGTGLICEVKSMWIWRAYWK